MRLNAPPKAIAVPAPKIVKGSGTGWETWVSWSPESPLKLEVRVEEINVKVPSVTFTPLTISQSIPWSNSLSLELSPKILST